MPDTLALIGLITVYLLVWRISFRFAVESDYPDGLPHWGAFVTEALTVSVFFWIAFPLAIARRLEESQPRGADKAARLIAGESKAQRQRRLQRVAAESERRLAILDSKTDYE